MSSADHRIVIPRPYEFVRGTGTDVPLVKQFFQAVDVANTAEVVKLLRAGVSINAHDMIGRTVFHIAAANANRALIKTLINWHGRDLNFQTFDFLHTPLHEAVLSESAEIVDMLLHAGAKVDLVNGYTRFDCLFIIYLNIYGQTATHLAVKQNSQHILDILVSYNANINVVDVFANTPLSISILETRNYHICIYLLRRGALVNKTRTSTLYVFHETILACLTNKDITFVKVLVKYGALINLIDISGRNALHYGAINGMPTVIKYLLRIGVEPNIKDNSYRTPLEIAQEHKHFEAEQLIANFSADGRTDESEINLHRKEELE